MILKKEGEKGMLQKKGKKKKKQQQKKTHKKPLPLMTRAAKALRPFLASAKSRGKCPCCSHTKLTSLPARGTLLLQGIKGTLGSSLPGWNCRSREKKAETAQGKEDGDAREEPPENPSIPKRAGIEGKDKGTQAAGMKFFGFMAAVDHQ